MYLWCFLPALFAFAVIQVTQLWLASQSVVKPAAFSTTIGQRSTSRCVEILEGSQLFLTLCSSLCAAALGHIPVSLLFVRIFGLESAGAAMGISFSYTVNALILLCYIFFSKKPAYLGLLPWSELFQEWKPFFRLALSGVMMITEWWASEIAVFLSGLLPNSDTTVSAMSIFVNTTSLVRFCNPLLSLSPLWN